MTLRETAPAWRIGMIVPSSSTTMETEVPELLRRQSQKSGDRFTCHAGRLRLKQVTPEALAAMNESAGSGVAALCDAEVDALIYACLVATMFGGRIFSAPSFISEEAIPVALRTLASSSSRSMGLAK